MWGKDSSTLLSPQPCLWREAPILSPGWTTVGGQQVGTKMCEPGHWSFQAEETNWVQDLNQMHLCTHPLTDHLSLQVASEHSLIAPLLPWALRTQGPAYKPGLDPCGFQSLGCNQQLNCELQIRVESNMVELGRV